MPGLSQIDCLTGKGSEGDRGPCAACQSARYVSKWVSAVQADANKICDWRSEVLAAEPKRREVPANTPDGYPGHHVLWANWPATTVYQKGWFW